MKLLSTYLVVIAALLCSCQKKEYKDIQPALEVAVKDVQGNPVSQVKVSLYETLDDWKAANNRVVESVTDAHGVVLFTDLNERIYYISAHKEELNNKTSSVVLSNKLKLNTKAKIHTVIK